MILLTLIGVSILFVGGCGNKLEGKVISFGSYEMKIPLTFEETDVSRFVNKRTEHHLIKSYADKLPPDSTDVFEKNIIVGVLKNEQHIDTTTYSRLSIQKLQKTFQGYQQLGLYKKSLTCGDKNIDVYIHGYSFRKLVDGDQAKTYYIVQSQRATDGFLYVVSASTDLKEDVDTYVEYMKTLKCKTEK